MAERQLPSGFDPNQFLSAQQTEVNVRRPPLPVVNPARSDGLYVGIASEVKMDGGTIGKGDRVGQPWLSAIVQVAVEVPPQVQDQLGIKLEKGTITLTDRPMIDLTPQKTIDNSVGRNRRQRQWRDALDLNKPGDVWAWSMAVGKPILIQVTHEMYNGEPQEKIGNILKFSS